MATSQYQYRKRIAAIQRQQEEIEAAARRYADNRGAQPIRSRQQWLELFAQPESSLTDDSSRGSEETDFES